MNIKADLLRLLMETGYLATGYGLTANAETIFSGIIAARPASEYPLIGQAVNQMNAGHSDDAVVILREGALNINPESDLARSFLGMALSLSGHESQSRNVLDEVARVGLDPVAADFARNLLQEGMNERRV